MKDTDGIEIRSHEDNCPHQPIKLVILKRTQTDEYIGKIVLEKKDPGLLISEDEVFYLASEDGLALYQALDKIYGKGRLPKAKFNDYARYTEPPDCKECRDIAFRLVQELIPATEFIDNFRKIEDQFDWVVSS